MTPYEKIKFVYKTMLENNPDEALKELIIAQDRYERCKKQKIKVENACSNYKYRINKAIEKYKNCKEEDYCTLALDMYDILKGEDNENN